jgi:hypothetical protein
MGRANNYLGSFATDVLANAEAAGRGWTGEMGWIYYDTTNAVIKEWNGTVWVVRSFHGGTVMVASTGGQYPTIAAAITAAAAGDTIQIYPGTYAESGLTSKAGVNWQAIGPPGSVIIAPAGAVTVLAVTHASIYQGITFQVANAAAVLATVNVAGTVNFNDCSFIGFGDDANAVDVQGATTVVYIEDCTLYQSDSTKDILHLSANACTVKLIDCQVSGVMRADALLAALTLNYVRNYPGGDAKFYVGSTSTLQMYHCSLCSGTQGSTSANAINAYNCSFGVGASAIPANAYYGGANGTATFRNCYFQGTSYGLNSQVVGTMLLFNCTIVVTGTAINFQASTGILTLSDCYLYTPNSCIVGSNAPTLYLYNSYLRSGTTAVSLTGGMNANSRLVDCTFDAPTNGIGLSGSSSAIAAFSGNIFPNTGKVAVTGVTFRATGQTVKNVGGFLDAYANIAGALASAVANDKILVYQGGWDVGAGLTTTVAGVVTIEGAGPGQTTITAVAAGTTLIAVTQPTIFQNLTLQVQNATSVLATIAGAITVTFNNVQLTAFGDDANAVDVSGGATVSFEDCTLYQTDSTKDILHSSANANTVYVSDCQVTGQFEMESALSVLIGNYVRLYPGGACATVLSNTARCEFYNCALTNIINGSSSATSVLAVNSYFAGAGNGIASTSTGSLTLRNCVVTGTSYGVNISGVTTGFYAYECQLHADDYGIRDSGNGGTIWLEGSTITSPGTAATFRNQTITMRGCTVRGNNYGLTNVTGAFGANSRIEGNLFYGGTADINITASFNPAIHGQRRNRACRDEHLHRDQLHDQVRRGWERLLCYRRRGSRLGHGEQRHRGLPWHLLPWCRHHPTSHATDHPGHRPRRVHYLARRRQHDLRHERSEPNALPD